MDPQTKNFRLLLLLVAFFVSTGLLLFLFNRSQQPMPIEVTTLPPVFPTAKQLEGSFALKTADSLTRLPYQQNFTLEISSTSNGVDVVGYDAVVQFDERFAVVNVTSVIPDFQIFKKVIENRVIITGVKSASSKNSHIWQDTKVVNLVFRPVSKGVGKIAILSEMVKDTTKFVDTASVVHYPTVNTISFEVY